MTTLIADLVLEFTHERPFSNRCTARRLSGQRPVELKTQIRTATAVVCRVGGGPRAGHSDPARLLRARAQYCCCCCQPSTGDDEREPHVSGPEVVRRRLRPDGGGVGGRSWSAFAADAAGRRGGPWRWPRQCWAGQPPQPPTGIRQSVVLAGPARKPGFRLALGLTHYHRSKRLPLSGTKTLRS
jgi:hypothetical protein